LLVFVGSVQLLERYAPEHLPPPAISNRLNLDEKLTFLRQRLDQQPTILAVGSSITMRSLDGAPFLAVPMQESFLNLGIGGAQVHQTRWTGNFYLDLFPTVHTVIQLVVPPDFKDCSATPRVLFNPADAQAYVRGDMSSVRAYLKYFNPHQLIGEALHIAVDRQRATGGDGNLYMDEFGSMPMDMTPGEAKRRHKQLYGELEPLDHSCFRELQQWSKEVGQRGARLVVVIPPFSPIFLRGIAGAPEYIDAFAQRVSDALSGGPAKLVDERSIGLGDEAFADAYHLLWPSARVFSRHVSSAVKQLTATAGKPDVANRGTGIAPDKI
jgi:hypothetical protein